MDILKTPLDRSEGVVSEESDPPPPNVDSVAVLGEEEVPGETQRSLGLGMVEGGHGQEQQDYLRWPHFAYLNTYATERWRAVFSSYLATVFVVMLPHYYFGGSLTFFFTLIF